MDPFSSHLAKKPACTAWLGRCFLAMVLLLAGQVMALAGDPEPRIHHTQCSLDSHWLRLGFQAEHVFDRQELIQDLEAGTPVTFTYSVRVMQRRKGWMDKMLEEVKAVKSAERDALTGRYKVIFWVDGVERETNEFETLEEVLAWMVFVPSINVMPAENLQDRKAYLKVMGHFMEDLKVVIPWDYETDWLKVEIPDPAEVPVEEPAPEPTPEPAPETPPAEETSP